MQKTFEKELTVRSLGLITPGGTNEVITLLPAADVMFGVPVKRAAGQQCETIAADTDTIVGLAAVAHNTAGAYLASEEYPVSVLTKGSMSVLVDTTAVAPLAGKKAYALPAVVAGGYRKFTTVATAAAECGVFQTEASAGAYNGEVAAQLAVIKIDIVA